MKNLKAQRRFVSLLSLILLAGLMMTITTTMTTSAYAQITPLGDSYTNTADPTTNYGAKTLLDVDGATQITYIQFNLASVPATASVSQATLKLYVNTVSTAGSFNVDYVSGAWSESTIDASNAPALGAAIASGVAITTADKNQYILINVTSAVQAWLSGSETNEGLALVANGSFDATFDSKENTTTSHPAELDIAFAGGDGTITGVNTASGSGLTGGGTSGTLNLSLTNACAANQILQWNGTGWVCSSAGTGTITGVTAGTDLTGGGTSGNVTLNVNTSALNATYALLTGNNNFTGAEIVNGSVSATGVIIGSSYQIGSNLFAYGSYASRNAFLGFGGNTTQTGTGNAVLGYEALAANTSGFANTAAGLDAMEANTTGSGNTAVGTNALGTNTTGYDNTAAGEGSLYYSTTGTWNTAVGINAGIMVSANPFTGSYNTAVGGAAAFASTTLEFATLLGYNTITDQNNSTAIGANATVTEPNAMVLGSINGVNGATASTNVGIGTTAPNAALDVEGNNVQTLVGDPGCGSGYAGIGFVVSGGFNSCTNYALLGDNPGNVYINSSLSGNIYFRNNNGANLMNILSSGLVGIGTESPDDTLSVNGNADKPGGGSWGTFSDGRLKDLSGTFNSGLEQIMKIRPVRYRYKPDNAMGIRDTEEHIGVVAQEVQKAIPEAVTENSKGYLLVNNDPVIWAMLNAIKELQGQIEQQQHLLRAQAAAVRSLKAEVRETREALRKVKAQVAAAQLTTVAVK